MAGERPFISRTEGRMGEIYVDLTIENGRESGGSVSCRAMVDTGAFGLILPSVWKAQLGDMPELSLVDLEMADQRVVTAEIRGPVVVQLEGFRRVGSEVIFVDMEPRADGSYEPLVGYTVLELANVVIDMRRHCLVAKKYHKLKRCA
jgi:predicted aspartyl protease